MKITLIENYEINEKEITILKSLNNQEYKSHRFYHSDADSDIPFTLDDISHLKNIRFVKTMDNINFGDTNVYLTEKGLKGLIQILKNEKREKLCSVSGCNNESLEDCSYCYDCCIRIRS